MADLGLWVDSNSGSSFLSDDLQTARLVADSEIQGATVPEISGLGINPSLDVILTDQGLCPP